MMTVPDSYSETEIDYKQKYKLLKKKLKHLVYEQECFLEELRKAQRKLLKVAKDRSFLLDRLIQYEKVEDSSGDSEATASSDSDAEGHHRDGIPAKRKRVGGHGGGTSHSQTSASGEGGSQQALPSSIANIILAQQAAASGSQEGGKKRAKTSNKKAKTGAAKTSSQATVASMLPASSIPGQMTREELERHLDSKQNVFGIEKATASLPMDIFSNDNSNNACDPTGNGGTGEEDEEDLVIDIPH